MIHNKRHGNSNYTNALAKQNKPVDKTKYIDMYPNKVDLTPGSAIHDAIVFEIKSILTASKNKMSKFNNQWLAAEGKMQPYVPTKKASDITKETGTMPIYIPLSYATLQTWLTFMVNSFLIKNPIFRFTSLNGSTKSTIGAVLLERIIHYQSVNNSFVLPLHTMFRDSAIYGIGAIAPSWEVRAVRSSGQLKNADKKIVPKKIVTFEGNRLTNIHPRNLFPDPNVSLNRINDGNFIGWSESTSINKLMNVEADGFGDTEGGMFNVDYLIDELGTTNYNALLFEPSTSGDTTSAADSIQGIGSSGKANNTSVISVYINLVPAKWGLGTGTLPEMWLIMIAGEKVIIKASPVSLLYDGFPIVACSPETDGYSMVNNSKISMIDGLQDTINWYFHSHVANVKKVVNDTFIYNPFLVNEADVLNPKAGGAYRLNQIAWGIPNAIDQAIKQLEVHDVTQGHMTDINSLMGLRAQVSGVSNEVMGIMATTGERRTKAEANNSFDSATNRIEADAFIIQEQAIKPLGKMIAKHTQQFMSQQTTIQLTKEAIYKLTQEYGIKLPSDKVSLIATREDIDIDFEISVNDNFMTKGQDLEAMRGMFEVALQSPEMSQNIDMPRLFLHVMRESGAPNAFDFYKINKPTAQVLPDEEIAKMQAEGQVKPVEVPR